ncbi:MAG: PleD family two-component system response regulator [Desulfuromonadales bacterium]
MNQIAKKILVVDDDVNHLQTTREILECEGYRVIIHESPFRTTQKILQEAPDLILLDVNMPALSGERLCGLLREQKKTRDLPVLFYSSNDEDSLRQAVRNFGGTDYVCKGDLAGLRRKVKSLTSGA